MVSIYELKLGAEKLEILKALSAEIEKAIASIGKIDNSRLNAIYNDILVKANQVLQNTNTTQSLKDDVDIKHRDISEKAATINQKFEQQQALQQSLQKLKAEIEALLKSGLIDDTAEKTTTTYSSKKIGDMLKLKIDKADFDNLKSTVGNKLGKNDKAADSAKLGGLAADKYALKDDIPSAATETKAGIVKLKNSITGSLSDTAVSEKAIADFIASNFANSRQESGYTKLPNGLIFQWGRIGEQTNDPIRVNYPIAFPNLCLSLIIGNLIDAAPSTTGGVGHQKINPFDNNKTGFTAKGPYGYTSHYIAIGY
ncbi:MAG: hypothetical protein KH703_00365 [Campylobacter gracilis]|uniref:gp53-like domain-containing protein n=1 Tax=Campylobacter gracilis TaxID=824 RepID=UPI0026EBD711|nr:hypothetical protein [Campylobacter gracilis]MBS6151867.1 hypothetical protein [Campylobacter gracilis]